MKGPAIILARLTAREYLQMREARIPYTGATRQADGYKFGPYVATYYAELVRALDVLGWRRLTVRIRPTQWIVTHKERS